MPLTGSYFEKQILSRINISSHAAKWINRELQAAAPRGARGPKKDAPPPGKIPHNLCSLIKTQLERVGWYLSANRSNAVYPAKNFRIEVSSSWKSSSILINWILVNNSIAKKKFKKIYKYLLIHSICQKFPRFDSRVNHSHPYDSLSLSSNKSYSIIKLPLWPNFIKNFIKCFSVSGLKKTHRVH